jgi:hypothetical protein
MNDSRIRAVGVSAARIGYRIGWPTEIPMTRNPGDKTLVFGI